MSEFRDLSKEELTAMSGWAMVRKPEVGERAGEALDKFRTGCHALSDEIEYVIDQKPEKIVIPQEAVCTPRTERQDVSMSIPAILEDFNNQRGSKASLPKSRDLAVQLSIPESRDPSECEHKFHIQTQHCVYCNITYRKSRGHKPEFF